MESPQANSRAIQIYHLCFVVFLVLVLLSVLVMSTKQQGPGQLEENFFPKNFLIENFNRLRLGLGDRVFNDVLIGKNGWMEFTADRNLDDYQRVARFQHKDLRAIAETIQSCYQHAQERDITFLIVVAPNKASIYPDKLPDQIQPLSGQSRFDQLNDYLKKHHIPQILDLRPALREARQQRDVYYKTGTHWNEYGAYIAYETILRRLSQTNPDLKPYSASFLRFRYLAREQAPRGGDIGLARLIQAHYLGLEQSWYITRNTDDLFQQIKFPFPEGTGAYHEIAWIPDSDLPSLLIFHDSFGAYAINRLLALNFSKVYYVHRLASSQYLNWPSIDQFSPNVVIYETVERDLYAIGNDLAGCKIISR